MLDSVKISLLNKTIAEEALSWTHVENTVYKDKDGNTQYAANWAESLPHAVDLANKFEVGYIPSNEDGKYTAFEISSLEPESVDFVPSTVVTSDTLPVALCLAVLRANSINTTQFE